MAQASATHIVKGISSFVSLAESRDASEKMTVNSFSTTLAACVRFTELKRRRNSSGNKFSAIWRWNDFMRQRFHVSDTKGPKLQRPYWPNVG